ncbi:DUF3429 domain-containing protein [Erythrobacter sp. GH1-10]|uniref:DUF3429 domain-containing protein n=1 Tax=Erythrobacter sp. GH1-10 TaxID=3349334 RepID=UPI003877E644
MDGPTTLTPAARWLGYAGLLPQIACLYLAASGHEYAYTALFLGFAYPAAIFSFLGGVWWGQAIQNAKYSGNAGAGAYILAVLPSLIAVAFFIPYNIGWEWPGPAMMYLGAFILASPLVDRALGYATPDFMRLRIHLSVGLGVLTIVTGIVAQAIL